MNGKWNFALASIWLFGGTNKIKPVKFTYFIHDTTISLRLYNIEQKDIVLLKNYGELLARWTNLMDHQRKPANNIHKMLVGKVSLCWKERKWLKSSQVYIILPVLSQLMKCLLFQVPQHISESYYYLTSDTR